MTKVEEIMGKVDDCTEAVLDLVLGGEGNPDEEFAKLRAMIAQYRKEAVPEGWKLVPVDPTKGMIKASAKIDESLFRSCEDFNVYIYKTMIESAPKQEEV